VREEAIQDRRRRRHITEKDAPVLRWSIRCNQCRRRFVSADEDLEQVLGRRGTELLHAEIFEDQQVDARQLLDEVAASARGLGLGEVRGQVEGAAHERAAAGADRADREGRRDMRFADTGRADQQDAALTRDEAGAGQFNEFPLGDLRIEGPVEVGERLHHGDAGLFQAAHKEPIGAARELILDEQFEKLEMGQRGRFGLRDAPGQGLDHAGEPEVTESGRELRIHDRKSSRVYWVMGRIAGSSVRSVGRGRASVRSTSWRMV
jgi:hypothetical protein